MAESDACALLHDAARVNVQVEPIGADAPAVAHAGPRLRRAVPAALGAAMLALGVSCALRQTRASSSNADGATRLYAEQCEAASPEVAELRGMPWPRANAGAAPPISLVRYVNAEGDSQRRDAMETQLEGLRSSWNRSGAVLRWQRVTAVGAETFWMDQDFAQWRAKGFSTDLEEDWESAARAYSHFEAISGMPDTYSEAEGLVLIVDDRAKLRSGFLDMWQDLWPWLPENWDVLRLGWNADGQNCSQVVNSYIDSAAWKRSSEDGECMYCGAEAYIVNPASKKRVLARFEAARMADVSQLLGASVPEGEDAAAVPLLRSLAVWPSFATDPEATNMAVARLLKKLSTETKEQTSAPPSSSAGHTTVEPSAPKETTQQATTRALSTTEEAGQTTGKPASSTEEPERTTAGPSTSEEATTTAPSSTKGEEPTTSQAARTAEAEQPTDKQTTTGAFATSTAADQTTAEPSEPGEEAITELTDSGEDAKSAALKMAEKEAAVVKALAQKETDAKLKEMNEKLKENGEEVERYKQEAALANESVKSAEEEVQRAQAEALDASKEAEKTVEAAEAASAQAKLKVDAAAKVAATDEQLLTEAAEKVENAIAQAKKLKEERAEAESRASKDEAAREAAEEQVKAASDARADAEKKLAEAKSALKVAQREANDKAEKAETQFQNMKIKLGGALQEEGDTLAEAQQALAEAQAEAEEHKKEAEQAKKELEKAKQVHEHALAQAKDMSDQLKSQAEQHKARADANEAKLEELEAESDVIKAKLSELQDRISHSYVLPKPKLVDPDPPSVRDILLGDD